MKKQCNNCNETDKKSLYLVEILHKPISPYFSSYYISIISIVFGTTMAFVLDKLYVFLENSKSVYDCHRIIIFWKFLIIILCIAVIWYSYMKLTQYKAWPLNIVDTIIPVLYASTIYLLVFYINNNGLLMLMFSFLCGLGAWAYWNTLMRMEKKEAKDLYYIHFSNYSPVIHLCIFHTIYLFTKNAFLFYRNIFVLFLTSSIVCIIFSLNTNRVDDQFVSLVLCFFMSLAAIYAFTHDLNKELRKNECLSKYF